MCSIALVKVFLIGKVEKASRFDLKFNLAIFLIQARGGEVGGGALPPFSPMFRTAPKLVFWLLAYLYF